MIGGLITAVLLAGFCGITYWAWSSRNRARFDDAAQLPLRDDVDASPCRQPSGCGCRQEK